MAQHPETQHGIAVSSARSQPTYIDVHIHQESALAQLIKAAGSLKQFLSRPPDRWPFKAEISHAQLALGVTQVLLGAMSCALGVCLYLGPWTALSSTGCAFWAGCAAMAAGAGALVYEKRRGKVAGLVSGLLTLAGLATAVAATVLCVNSLTWQAGGYVDVYSLCDFPAPEVNTGGYRRNWRAGYDTNWKVEECRATMQKMTNVFRGCCALLAALCILTAITALVSLGLLLRSVCGQSSPPLALDEEGSEKTFLEANPGLSFISGKKTPVGINP